MVANRFDDCVHPAVADAEPLAGHAANVRLTARRTVERDVSDDDVLLGHKCRSRGRIDNNPASAETLADVVIRITL